MPNGAWKTLLLLYLNTRNWLNIEEGQDLAEHGLLLGFLAVVVMIAVVALGASLVTFWGTLAAAVGFWTAAGAGQPYGAGVRAWGGRLVRAAAWVRS